MSEYYWIIIWIGAFAFFTKGIRTKQLETVCGKKTYRYTMWWAVVAVLPLLYMCATRGYIGDTGAYMKAFREMPDSFAGFSSYLDGVKKDDGFYAFSALLKIFLGDSVKVYFFALAAIQALLMVKVYRKYSTRYAVSLFLFLASTDYISWMFNGIRQFLAVTITFAACTFLLKKRYLPSILLILLATTVHGTALLMLPFVFIVQGKAWNKKTVLFILATIVVVSYVEQFTEILDTLLQETQYKNVVSEWEDDGTNVVRVLVYSIPVLLSVVGLKHIRKADNPIINMSTNMSIIAMGFYVVSIFTSGIYVGRLPIYFSLYNYILLPWEIDNLFTKRSAKLVYVLMAAGYLGFYLYSMSLMGV